MRHLPIGGIIPPVVTPLTGKGELDQEALLRIIDHVIAGGSTGLFLLGSTGEWASLPAGICREVVTQGVNGANGRLPVFVNISDSSLVELHRKANDAASAGADCLVISPPSYFAMTQDELLRFLELAIAGVPLPVLLYNAPQYTRTTIAPGTVAALVGHDRVVGIKDSSGDLEYMGRLVRTRPRAGFTILTGSELQLWESFRMGCEGGVCGGANLFPRLYTGFLNAMQEGNPDQIKHFQGLIKRIHEEVYAGFSTTLSHVIGLKFLMELRGLCRSTMALPVYNELSQHQKKTMAALLADFLELGY
jgi:dihydrodipicolinate synthase/N-acetylneuraminate lyase